MYVTGNPSFYANKVLYGVKIDFQGRRQRFRSISKNKLNLLLHMYVCEQAPIPYSKFNYKNINDIQVNPLYNTKLAENTGFALTYIIYA